MKKQLLSTVFCVAALAGINTSSRAQATVIYNWDFNGMDSSIHSPSYTAPGAGSAGYQYWAAYTDFTTGTSLNVMTGDTAGSCIRFRNPSDSVIFHMPTTGYHHIQFSYAEQRTGSGSQSNSIMFTTDGTHYQSATIADPAVADSANYTVDSVALIPGVSWELHTFTFTADTAAINNNPNFAIAIVFNDGPTGTSGNDRFDNITLKGDLLGTSSSTSVASVANATSYELYPNPVSGSLAIRTATAAQRTVIITNMLGQKVYESTEKDAEFSVNTASLISGNYLITIRDNSNVETMRFVKK